MINKFGQLEFKYGDAERAKTLYEKLLSSYPKRTDLWSIYIDMLIKYDREPISAARWVDSFLRFPSDRLELLNKYFQIDFWTRSRLEYSAEENEIAH